MAIIGRNEMPSVFGVSTASGLTGIPGRIQGVNGGVPLVEAAPPSHNSDLGGVLNARIRKQNEEAARIAAEHLKLHRT